MDGFYRFVALALTMSIIIRQQSVPIRWTVHGEHCIRKAVQMTCWERHDTRLVRIWYIQ
jgi:hypothetical protein